MNTRSLAGSLRPTALVALAWLTACGASPSGAYDAQDPSGGQNASSGRGSRGKSRAAARRGGSCTILPQSDPEAAERNAPPAQAPQPAGKPSPNATTFHGPPPIYTWRRQIIADVLSSGAECPHSEEVEQRSTNPDEMQLRRPTVSPYSRLPPMDGWDFLCDRGWGYHGGSMVAMQFRVKNAEVSVCLHQPSLDMSRPEDPQARQCETLPEVRRYGDIEIRWGAALPPELQQKLAAYFDCLGSGCGCSQKLD